MAEGLVGPHPGDARREGLGQQQVVEQVPPVVVQPGGRRPFVAPVEGAQEVAPVPTVEGQQRRRLGHQVGHEGGPLGRRQVAGGQPGVGVDHVGGDQGVLEVEGGQVAVGGEDVLPGPVGPVGLDRLARRGADPGVLDDRGQVDLADVGGPVDGAGVEAEGGPVVVVHAVPQGEQPVDPVEGLGLGVGAVELDVAEGPVGQQVLLLEGGHPLGPLAPDGERPDHPLGQRHGRRCPGELALDPTAARGTTTRAPRWAGRPGRRGGAPGTRRSPARPAGRSGTGSGRRRPRGTPSGRRRRRPGRRTRRGGAPRRPRR